MSAMTSYPEPEPLTTPGTSTSVLERTEPEVDHQTDSGDHERFAHYVRKEKIVESAVTGEPVTALCGKIWVPGRDPNRFPVCPMCKEIYEGLRAPQDGGE
ncbi:DUF3039 domain-containing protein [Mobilicoccus sp.]|uniref:DUF3039 domain-containing protein n=1 Tax=Mobilicoccus sp. TaxID=2034349 RepID=UPI00289E2DEC|nr:DUF3039 domain-containing protein [Mobilicoccus sp.]